MPSDREDKQCPVTGRTNNAQWQGAQTMPSDREDKQCPVVLSTYNAQWQGGQSMPSDREDKTMPSGIVYKQYIACLAWVSVY